MFDKTVDGTARLVVFGVGEERFAVPLTDVHEVIEAPAVRPLPDAPPTVLGVATIRGAFVVMHDPRPLLHVGGRIDGAALLFMRDGRRIGLAVGDVFDAITATDDELRPPPVVGGANSFVIGVMRRGTDLIAVVDSRAMLDAAVGAHGEVGEGERRQP